MLVLESADGENDSACWQHFETGLVSRWAFNNDIVGNSLNHL
jgi:hypothetical protein